jgi:hypothetical protein
LKKQGLKKSEFVDSSFFVYNLLQKGFEFRNDIKEAIMFQVTAKASEKIQEFFKDKQDEAIIRIFLSQGG